MTDELRVIALYNYGGFWFDFDTLFLRDMTGLSNREFVYRWERQSYANNAIMSLHRKSPKAYAIMHQMLLSGSSYASSIYTDRFCREIGLDILPCEWFDAGWLDDSAARFFSPTEDTCESFLQKHPQALAYHWHNKWDAYMQPSSIAAKFLAYYDT